MNEQESKFVKKKSFQDGRPIKMLFSLRIIILTFYVYLGVLKIYMSLLFYFVVTSKIKFFYQITQQSIINLDSINWEFIKILFKLAYIYFLHWL